MAGFRAQLVKAGGGRRGWTGRGGEREGVAGARATEQRRATSVVRAVARVMARRAPRVAREGSGCRMGSEEGRGRQTAAGGVDYGVGAAKSGSGLVSLVSHMVIVRKPT